MAYPIESPSDAGPPRQLRISLILFVLVCGIGGAVRYWTREKPNGKPIPTPELAASNSPHHFEPAPVTTIAPNPENVVQASAPPAMPTFNEDMSEVRPEFRPLVAMIWNNSPRSRNVDNLRLCVAKWCRMDRAAQEEVLRMLQVLEKKSRDLTAREREVFHDLTGEAMPGVQK